MAAATPNHALPMEVLHSKCGPFLRWRRGSCSLNLAWRRTSFASGPCCRSSSRSSLLILTICFPCKAVFQTCRPRPPLRIIKIVDRAVGEVGACQSATNALLQAADAKHAIDADPRRPRALPSAPGKRPDFIRNHVVFVDFGSTHQAIGTFGAAAELAHDDCPPFFSSKRQGRPFNLWNLILIGGTSSRT
jgi:hypothetical protein